MRKKQKLKYFSNGRVRHFETPRKGGAKFSPQQLFDRRFFSNMTAKRHTNRVFLPYSVSAECLFSEDARKGRNECYFRVEKRGSSLGVCLLAAPHSPLHGTGARMHGLTSAGGGAHALQSRTLLSNIYCGRYFNKYSAHHLPYRFYCREPQKMNHKPLFLTCPTI